MTNYFSSLSFDPKQCAQVQFHDKNEVIPFFSSYSISTNITTKEYMIKIKLQFAFTLLSYKIIYIFVTFFYRSFYRTHLIIEHSYVHFQKNTVNHIFTYLTQDEI